MTPARLCSQSMPARFWAISMLRWRDGLLVMMAVLVSIIAQMAEYDAATSSLSNWLTCQSMTALSAGSIPVFILPSMAHSRGHRPLSGFDRLLSL